MVDAIGQLVGDLASVITDAIARFLVRSLNLSPTPVANGAIKILVYALIFVPVAITVVVALVYVFLHVGVFLLNWWLASMTR